MLANGPIGAVLRLPRRVKLVAGVAASVLLWYVLFAEKNGGFDETTGLGRALDRSGCGPPQSLCR